MLSFLHPYMMWAAGLASIPIILHLYHRRRARAIPWAAMEFLLASVRRSARWFRVRQLLLLAIRVLILLLAAFAAARPLLRSASGAGFRRNAATYAVIILDNSYSMGWRDAQGVAFDRARQAAVKCLSVLQPGDSASLILASDVPRPAIKEPSYDLGAVRRTIAAAALSQRATDLSRAIALAATWVSRSSAPNKEVYIVTDMQASAWPKRRAAAGELASLSRAARVQIVDVGGRRPGQAAITAVALSDPAPVPGSPVRITATLRSYGNYRGPQTARLFVDGRPVASAAVDLRPGAQVLASFTVRLDGVGYHSGYVELPADALAVDNRRFFALAVQPSRRVLIVDGSSAADPFASGGAYVRVALSPGGQASDFAPAAVAPSNLFANELAGASAVVLSGVGRLDPACAAALAQFVRAGGGLLVLPGDNMDLSYYNGYARRMGLVPASMTRAPAHAGEDVHLDPSIAAEPAVEPLTELKPATITAPRVFRRLALGGSGATVLLRFADGRPALVEGRLGRGRVLLLATSFAPAWSDLQVRPLFVPLLHTLMGHLCRGQTSQLSREVGEGLACRAPAGLAGQPIAVVAPNGRRFPASVSTEDGALLLSHPNAEASGVYRFVAGSRTVAAFAVNPPAEREGDPARISARRLRAIYPGFQFALAAAGDDLRQRVMLGRTGMELDGALLWILLLLMLLELVAARVAEGE